MKKILWAAVLFNCSSLSAQYSGTASVTQGPGSVTTPNLYACPGGRTPAVGTINASDNSVWTVPAVVNFENNSFPFASDLHNPCTGATYATSAEALNVLNGSDIITIDPTGEVITAYIFADNYFEMYVNGIPVGKDNVPYTQFNSNIVRFRVNRPFTIAMLLVDWEENLGIGTENNNGFLHHIGDGGMVAVFKDAINNTVAMTGSDWKAQTFYSSPIKDLSCPSENGTLRLTTGCSTTDSQDGSNYYGLHWSRPAGWMTESFDDSSWPNATVYTNAEIGVDNKPAYMNFTNIFDDPTMDAQFIWSTNVILDNEVIVRKTVDQSTGLLENEQYNDPFTIVPNPVHDLLEIKLSQNEHPSFDLSITDVNGKVVLPQSVYNGPIDVSRFPKGTYLLHLQLNHQEVHRRFVLN